MHLKYFHLKNRSEWLTPFPLCAAQAELHPFTLIYCTFLLNERFVCICRFFIGTSVSTFSFRIHEEREILGFDPKTTYNRFCGDTERECEQPTHWKIVYWCNFLIAQVPNAVFRDCTGHTGDFNCFTLSFFTFHGFSAKVHFMTSHATSSGQQVPLQRSRQGCQTCINVIFNNKAAYRLGLCF